MTAPGCARTCAQRGGRGAFGEPVRRVFELGEDDRPLVDRQGEQRHAVVEGLLEPVGELVGGPD